MLVAITRSVSIDVALTFAELNKEQGMKEQTSATVMKLKGSKKKAITRNEGSF